MAKTPTEQSELQAFADKLIELMAQKGMSQSDLARHIWGSAMDNRGRDVARNRDRISNYVRGKQMPEAKTLKVLADVFGVRAADLCPSLAQPKDRTGLPDMAFSIVGGRPDLALLTINKVLPVQVAVQVLALIAKANPGTGGT